MKKVALFALVLVMSMSNIWAQCAMCAATVGSNKDESLIGTGINKGILFLMAGPYILLGIVGYVWYRHRKKLNENK